MKFSGKIGLVGAIVLSGFAARAAMPVPVLPQPQAVFEKNDGGSTQGAYKAIEVRHHGYTPRMTAAVERELSALGDASAQTAFTVECRVMAKPSAVRGQFAGRELAAYADSLGEEGYLLSLEHPRAVIAARTERGVYYGLQSLKQLLRAPYTGNVDIADWPDFRNRIFFDDISRGPLPTVPTVKRQIEQLAELKYSGLTFYIEHVVEIAAYPDFAPANGRYTMADVREIAAYAAQYNMELIGGFQSFGHFEHILALPQYAHMGETPSLISPLDPDAKRFLKAVIGELCDNFSSVYFNINADETWDLDKGRSREYVARIGADRFYADHIRFLYDIVRGKGKKTLVWGDIVMKYPHIIKTLPNDIIYLPWNYSPLESFDRWITPFVDAGATFWVCPGIVASNRLTPEMQVVRGNMEFIRQGHAAGAQGVILTSWDDPGLHNFAQLFYGAALGAETMWNVGNTAPKDDFDTRFEINRFGYADAGFVAALDALLELAGVGVTYQMGEKVFNDAFVPRPGEPLSVNLGQWKTAGEIVSRAEELFRNIRHRRNAHDLETLAYTIAQYRFMVDARLAAASVGGIYAEAERQFEDAPRAARATLLGAFPHIAPVSAQLDRLQNEFTRLWLTENLSYFHDYGLDRYVEKRSQLDRMNGAVIAAIDSIDRRRAPIPALAAGLDLRDVNSDYFGAWLFTGIFPDGDLDTDHLAAVGGERNENPVPGQRYAIDGRDLIWTRVLSPNGFTMNFLDRYDSENNALAYATAEIISPAAQEVTALFGTTGQAEIILNGEVVLRTGTEQSFTADKYPVALRLKEGSNRVIVKSKQLVDEWKFSFRLDGREIQAHKQRYRIQ